MLKLKIINIASSISIYPIQKGGGGGGGKKYLYNIQKIFIFTRPEFKYKWKTLDTLDIFNRVWSSLYES